MKQLAEENGIPLFDQAGRSIALSDAGKELYATTQAIFDAWRQFEMRIADLRGLKRGQLRLAVATTAKYLIPDLLGGFCTQYPDIDVKLEIANREVLIERLKQGRDDIYIMVCPPEGDEFERLPFLGNELVVVAPAGHALARAKAIPAARVARERFILREPGSGTRVELERFFHEKGVVPNVRMELGSNEAIKHAVAAGLGVSVLSTLTLHVDPMLDHLAVLDVAGFPIKSEWFVVFPAQRRLSVVAQAFSDHLRGESARMRASHDAEPRGGPERKHKKAA
jgi:DNA-binding transcriptional LysR family regulator